MSDITILLQKRSIHEEICLNFIFQNFVIYILNQNFEEIYGLLDSFFEIEQKQLVINQALKDATFIKCIMDEKAISLEDIKDITCFFDDETKEMYRI